MFIHVQGEMHSLEIQESHYGCMLEYLASEDEGICIESPNHNNAIRISA